MNIDLIDVRLKQRPGGVVTVAVSYDSVQVFAGTLEYTALIEKYLGIR